MFLAHQNMLGGRLQPQDAQEPLGQPGRENLTWSACPGLCVTWPLTCKGLLSLTWLISRCTKCGFWLYCHTEGLPNRRITMLPLLLLCKNRSTNRMHVILLPRVLTVTVAPTHFLTFRMQLKQSWRHRTKSSASTSKYKNCNPCVLYS